MGLRRGVGVGSLGGQSRLGILEPIVLRGEAGLVQLGHAMTHFPFGQARGHGPGQLLRLAEGQANTYVTSLPKPMSSPVTSAHMIDTKTITTAV